MDYFIWISSREMEFGAEIATLRGKWITAREMEFGVEIYTLQGKWITSMEIASLYGNG